MQVIYAAPFILLSLIAFVIFLAIPRLRPYTFRALVAPVAFGFCSIVSMVLIGFMSYGLGLPFTLVGLRGLFLGIAIYFIPGLMGAWIAVEIVRQIEIRALKTQQERDFATRIIISLIIFGPAFIICIGVQFKFFPNAEAWSPLFLALSFVAAALAAILSYLLVRVVQERVHAAARTLPIKSNVD